MSKLTGGKNPKSWRRGLTWKILARFILFTGNIEWKSKFSSFITHKLWEHLVGVSNTIHIQSLFNDYHVTTLKIIHPITFQNYTKHSIKVLGNKNNMYMQPFSKTLPTIHLNIFVPNVFNKRNLPEIQDKRLCPSKKTVSSKKCT